jgi:hypothetical protein
MDLQGVVVPPGGGPVCNMAPGAVGGHLSYSVKRPAKA